MEYIVICTVTLITAALTLFSGFGLGTILMPVFAIFFPVEIAIAATAIVHLANNLFKLVLVGKNADLKIVLKFAVPAAIFAVFGAALLNHTANIPAIFQYYLGSRLCIITATKIVISFLIAAFSIFELVPRFNNISFSSKYLPLGGAISGFFGGLSGHQGAMRTAFLIRLGLVKEVFIGTVVVSAIVVDISRLVAYGMTFFSKHFDQLANNNGYGLMIAGIISAFTGSFLGSRLIKKITMRGIQLLVGILLLIIAIALGSGII